MDRDANVLALSLLKYEKRYARKFDHVQINSLEYSIIRFGKLPTKQFNFCKIDA